MKSKLVIKNDSVREISKIIDLLRDKRTLVGIPQNGSNRDPQTGEYGPINNAALLFINNFGSPDNNIPPRPVMDIGIRLAQDDIASEFRLVGEAALDKKTESLNKYYERIGIIGSNSIKRVINDNLLIDEPSEATLEARKRKGFGGKKALIVTGQMRNAITYVVE